MITIRLKNGFINLTGDCPNFPWLTEHGSNKYFLPSEYTRKLFLRDFYPIKDRLDIDKETLDYIRNIDLTNKIASQNPLATLEGITYLGYQEEAIKRALTHKNYCLFFGPGTGKTIMAIGFLKTEDLRKALIITPKKVIGQYRVECNKFIPDFDITILNYEQIESNPHQVMTDWDAIIVDESHRVKEYTSNTSHNLRIIAQKAKRVLLFTGTPQDKGRADLLAQFSIFNKGFMPSKSKTLRRFFELDEYFKPTTLEKQPEELTSLILSVSWGATTDSVLKLPKKIDTLIRCPMLPEQRELYDELMKESICIWDDGTVLLCDTPGAKLVRLRQICNGGLGFTPHNDQTKRVTKTFPSGKEVELEALTSDMSSAIIYTQFDLDITVVTRVLDKNERSYVVVNGKTVNSDPLIDEFKSGKVDFLVIQAQSGNAGLDLSNTNNIIFYSLPSSYIVFEQCQFRIRRIGQEKDCNYYYLITDKSVEGRMLKILSTKKHISAKTFGLW